NRGEAAPPLDDLVAATGMNRPSVYGAFGDKQAIYNKAFERYMAAARVAMKQVLTPDRSLREVLRRFYHVALSLYFSGDGGARGCFMIGTAASEAVRNRQVRAVLGDGLREIDEALEARMRLAQQQREL